jgi:hypothetical protein
MNSLLAYLNQLEKTKDGSNCRYASIIRVSVKKVT